MALSGYGRQQEYVIQASLIDTALVNFSCFLDHNIISSEAFDADGTYPAINGGDDFKFSSLADGATQYACHIRQFVTDNNPANGLADVVVKIPVVASSVNTSFWGNWNKAGDTKDAASDPYGSENSMDANTFGQYDLSQDPTIADNIFDSTSEDNHMTGVNMTSGSVVTTTMGDGLSFDGNAAVDYCAKTLPSGAPVGSSAYSCHIRCMPRTAAVAQNMLAFFGAGNVGKALYIEFGKQGSLIPAMGFWGGDLATGNLMTINTWNSLGYTYTPAGTVCELFQAGASVNTSVRAIDFIANRMELAAANTLATGDCIITEARFSSVVRADAWFKAEHENWDGTTTFMTAGTPQSPAAAWKYSGITQPKIAYNSIEILFPEVIQVQTPGLLTRNLNVGLDKTLETVNKGKPRELKVKCPGTFDTAFDTAMETMFENWGGQGKWVDITTGINARYDGEWLVKENTWRMKIGSGGETNYEFTLWRPYD